MGWPNRGRKRGYWLNILVGIDQGIGTWIGIDADETISSYVGRNLPGSWQEKFIDWIFYQIDGRVGHCANSVES